MEYIIEDDGVSKSIVCCIADVGRFDFFSYEMLCANEIKGVINLQYSEHNGMDAIRYDISRFDTLRNHLSFRITMDNLLSIFMQVISIFEEIGDYMLDGTLLVTDISQIYYDRMHNEVQMIYFPITEEGDKRTCEERLFLLFREIVFSAKFVVGNDDRYITEVLNEIRDIKDYSLADFKDVVYRLYEKAGVSSGREITDYMTEEKVVCDSVLKVAESSCEYITDDIIEHEEMKEECYGGIKGFIRRLLHRRDNENNSVTDEYSIGQYEEVSSEEDKADLQEAAEEENDETMVLLRGFRGVYTPYLVRTSNNEQIAISKRIFKVGKDKRYADYVISDNAAISRAHAEFMIKDGGIYLTDEDSLNCTYVNGEKLVSQQETEVKNGDVISFADEEYVLYC